MSEPCNWFPPAPELHGELLLDVFTHRSLRQDGGSGDNERLATLGEKVLEAAITHCIFIRYPHYMQKEILEERTKQLSDQNYKQWTAFYRLREKLRYNHSVVDEVNSPEGIRELFHAYVGGVYTQANGPTTVNSWIFLLVVPPEERPKLTATSMPHHLSSSPTIQMYNSSQQPPSHMYHSPQQPPPPPSHPYPMAPPPPPNSNSSTPRSRTSSMSSARNIAMTIDDPTNGIPYNAPPNGKSIYLPRFNEISTNRRMKVDYPAEQRGLQHAPRWVVKCIVDDMELGLGVGTTKQLAKEEAARQAFMALGFKFRGS